LIQYQSQFGHLTLSAFTIFEHVDGLYRVGKLAAVKEFLQVVMPDLEVIYADHEITLLGAEINAALSKGGQTIGVLDTLIAATAIHNGLTLVNANTRHFPRIQAAGFPLTLENWRNS
jgi:tRNA(fMet)-specific endonuclease VapC